MAIDRRFAYRAGFPLIVGSAFVVVLFMAMDANALTAMLGIFLLMPGISLGLAVIPHITSPIAMLICNSLIYSGGVALLAWPLTKKTRRDRLRHLAPYVFSGVVIASFLTLGIAHVLKHTDWMQMCSNTVIHEYPAPQEKYKAVLFSRGCGAVDSGDTTHLSIIKMKDRIDVGDEGNVFIAAPKDFEKGGDLNIGVEWQSPKNLLLRFSAITNPYRSEKSWKDINVAYEERQAP